MCLKPKSVSSVVEFVVCLPGTPHLGGQLKWLLPTVDWRRWYIGGMPSALDLPATIHLLFQHFLMCSLYSSDGTLMCRKWSAGVLQMRHLFLGPLGVVKPHHHHQTACALPIGKNVRRLFDNFSALSGYHKMKITALENSQEVDHGWERATYVFL